MKKIKFLRKAFNIKVLKHDPGEKIEKKSFVIEKVIELSTSRFQTFAEHLLDDYDFIEENIKLMYTDASEIMHCILVKDENAETGILVESEGYTYARYAAYYEK